MCELFPVMLKVVNTTRNLKILKILCNPVCVYSTTDTRTRGRNRKACFVWSQLAMKPQHVAGHPQE
jgi:hypothetical protein